MGKAESKSILSLVPDGPSGTDENNSPESSNLDVQDTSALEIPEANTFHYLLAEKNKVLVISLVGGLGARAQLEFARCVKEVEEMDFSVAIVNFREIYGVDQSAVGYIATLKKVLRKKTSDIAICGIKPTVKDYLIGQGVMSKNEVFNNVKDSLLRFTSKQKAA